MSLEVEATYENGVLKLDQELPLENGKRVHITIRSVPQPGRRGYGLMDWKGTHEELEQFLGPDNHPWAGDE